MSASSPRTMRKREELSDKHTLGLLDLLQVHLCLCMLIAVRISGSNLLIVLAVVNLMVLLEF